MMKKTLTYCSWMLFFPALLTTQVSKAQNMNQQFEATSQRDAQIEKHLEDLKLENVQVSPEGIYYTVEQAGADNQKVNAGDYVSVHYTGSLLDGTKFDSSVDRGEPITFQIGVGQVIQGWEKGIPLFNVGGKGSVFIPSHLAYGERGAGGVIPPNAPLRFDIEVIETMNQEAFMQKQRELQLKLQAEAEARRAEQAKIDQATIEEYVQQNNLEVKYLQSGLAYYMTEEGTGEQVTSGSTAVVHYTGKLLDGTKFDSSKDRNQPFPVEVGANRVIQGWEQGLPLFKVGGKGTLIIPSTLAYGERGAGGIIRPNAVLLFDIEVLEVR